MGIVSLDGRDMLVVSVARVGRSFAHLVCCPGPTERAAKRCPGSAKLTIPHRAFARPGRPADPVRQRILYRQDRRRDRYGPGRLSPALFEGAARDGRCQSRGRAHRVGAAPVAGPTATQIHWWGTASPMRSARGRWARSSPRSRSTAAAARCGRANSPSPMIAG
jgi:hypothetical protein